ncbi:hypothetical protein IscW_ISCW017812 [Ixodes scapularis]|uniref:Uncharacterized protein n=1 Tax=Ixodes scapularis TaxID=6945 RepID=B7PET8_IXOSC|nr:hypothetical protein IscW_ISCW017812 [Ixodes scapularis]|eukprot:XP_002433710.1 hypothetical protein IscW_ISCW017812 [Ixodes scapularis]
MAAPPPAPAAAAAEPTPMTPRPVVTDEKGYHYRWDIAVGDTPSDLDWGEEIIKKDKRLSFEKDVRVQEFDKRKPSDEVVNLQRKPETKQQAELPETLPDGQQRMVLEPGTTEQIVQGGPGGAQIKIRTKTEIEMIPPEEEPPPTPRRGIEAITRQGIAEHFSPDGGQQLYTTSQDNIIRRYAEPGGGRSRSFRRSRALIPGARGLSLSPDTRVIRTTTRKVEGPDVLSYARKRRGRVQDTTGATVQNGYTSFKEKDLSRQQIKVQGARLDCLVFLAGAYRIGRGVPAGAFKKEGQTRALSLETEENKISKAFGASQIIKIAKSTFIIIHKG